jgi:hypothetical protein
MMTLEQSICRLENLVSGTKQKFLNSDLRNNTRESVELLKFNFRSLLKIKKESLREASLSSIYEIIFDYTPTPEYWQKRDITTYIDFCKHMEKERPILQDPDVLNECLECCTIILRHLDENLPEPSDDMSVRELNRRYVNKYLYFRDDDIGSQYVWVKKIHKNEEGRFTIDGTVIFTNGVNNTIGLYDVEGRPVEEFYCFGDKDHPFTRCDELDEALQEPMETRLKNHVITCRDVAEDVLFTLTWFYEIHIPELAKILKSLKFSD